MLNPAGKTLRILPESIANRIAAGEVVERPANAVKELLENSLDAGATEVTLELFEGGFRIVDNGSGMSRDDCLLSLERHATSKIGDVEDLDHIDTLGFRGEALPSIASVARLRMESRPAGEKAGTELLIEGGELTYVREAGLPAGTMVEVTDLFFNTPARRKFMRREATENGHIRETFSRMAMAFPAVGFRLIVNGRTTVDVPAELAPRERAARLFGNEFARQATEFAKTSSSLGYGLSGMLGHPRDNRARADEIYWFVNSRFIRDRTLNHALVSAYRQFMPHGRFPRAALFLTLPTSDVDVNVHPTKQEVRFVRGRDMYGFIAGAVTDILETWLQAQPNLVEESGDEESASRTTFPRSAPPLMSRYAGGASPVSADKGGMTGEQVSHYASTMVESQGMLRRKETLEAFPAEPMPSGDSGFYGRLAFLGQALGTYLVCQGDDGIVLIDQHAAHERVTYSAMLAAYRSGRPPVQGLLVPQVIELPPVALASLTEHQEMLTSIGFELAPFSGNAVAIQAVPAALAGRETRRVIIDVARELEELGRVDLAEEAVAERIIGCACQGSVRANQALSAPEVRALLKQLDEIERAGNCPHGRPVIISISRVELERRFGRSQ